jgi:hypothetical protein
MGKARMSPITRRPVTFERIVGDRLGIGGAMLAFGSRDIDADSHRNTRNRIAIRDKWHPSRARSCKSASEASPLVAARRFDGARKPRIVKS